MSDCGAHDALARRPSSAPVRWPHNWVGPPGRRVLVEDDDPWSRWTTAEALRAAGYDVGVCEGPELGAGRRCPLVEEGFCPVAEEADAVVFGLRLALPECRAVLGALCERGCRVIVETCVEQAPDQRMPVLRFVAYSEAHDELVRAAGSLAAAT